MHSLAQQAKVWSIDDDGHRAAAAAAAASYVLLLSGLSSQRREGPRIIGFTLYLGTEDPSCLGHHGPCYSCFASSSSR